MFKNPQQLFSTEAWNWFQTLFFSPLTLFDLWSAESASDGIRRHITPEAFPTQMASLREYGWNMDHIRWISEWVHTKKCLAFKGTRCNYFYTAPPTGREYMSTACLWSLINSMSLKTTMSGWICKRLLTNFHDSNNIVPPCNSAIYYNISKWSRFEGVFPHLAFQWRSRWTLSPITTLKQVQTLRDNSYNYRHATVRISPTRASFR